MIEALRFLRRVYGATSKKQRIILCSVRLNDSDSLDDAMKKTQNEIDVDLTISLLNTAMSIDLEEQIELANRLVLN